MRIASQSLLQQTCALVEFLWLNLEHEEEPVLPTSQLSLLFPWTVWRSRQSEWESWDMQPGTWALKCVTFSVTQMYKEKKVHITVMVFSSTHEHMRLGDHIKQNKELLLMTFNVLWTQWMTGLFLHYLLKNQDKKLESYETNTYGHWRYFLGREAEESLNWILRLQGSFRVDF